MQLYRMKCQAVEIEKTITRRLPFPVYFWPVFAVAVAGLLNMVYSSFSHYRVHTDILYVSLCAVSEAINCDTVSQNMYSIFLGMPVPVWGVLGYGFFLILLSFVYVSEAGHRRIWPMLFLTALCFSGYSLYLAYLLKFEIKVYCIVCLAGYGINFALLFLVWIIRRRFPEKGFFKGLKKDVKFICRPWKIQTTILLVFFGIAFILPFAYPRYWHFALPEITADIPTGITEDGDPWIGAENPELVITEYSDYMCFQCRKMHMYLRQIVAANPDKIRLVHRHFPMDPQFNPSLTGALHPASGKLAIAAAYAAQENRFWQMNDLLYDIPKDIKTLDIRELAQRSGVSFEGLASAPENRFFYRRIKRDVFKGIELGVTGTPTYEVEGNLYEGRIPVEVLKKSLE
ncbi:vitamin K epoxide reductase family protein [Desulfotignum balticum]|uniref:vitamin K epoxide reductase/DsbA family protein n=1 Tax=Desulfotignum balticum TaxID=115781 RepID=UPI0009FCCD02|nr:vitamin K epoxide reductase family protein [Desulfotignum balticum]